MPRVLVFSTTTGYQLRSFSDAAGELGIELMFATDRCHTLDDPWRDGAVPIRFHDEEGSLEAILRAGVRRIDGIVAVGDRPVVLAARAAEALHLPGNPPEAARASAHKRLARERFARAGLPAPPFVHATIHGDIPALARELLYPVVIKPVGLSGSRGVIRANDPRELIAAFHRVSALLSRPEIRALRTGTEQDLLIEEFIPGKEYAVEGLLTHGVLTPLALFDKPDPLDGPFFEETIYVTPAAVGTAARREICEAVQRGVIALGLRHGPIHAECRVNARGVFVLEIAARPIGGLCSRVLRFESPAAGPPPAAPTSRQSLEHLLLRHALGEDVSGIRRESGAAAVMMVPVPMTGVFRRVRGEEQARRVPHVEDIRITARHGQLLEPLPEAGSYLGFIFARAAAARDAEAAVRQAHRCLEFLVDSRIDVRGVPAESALLD